MSEAGSVLYKFSRRGELALRGAGEERAFDIAAEAGADDVEPYLDADDGTLLGYRLITDVARFAAVRDAVAAAALDVDDEASGLKYVPLATVQIEDPDALAENEAIYERCGGGAGCLSDMAPAFDLQWTSESCAALGSTRTTCLQSGTSIHLRHASDCSGSGRAGACVFAARTHHAVDVQ